MRLRQVVQLLDAAAQPDAEPFAAAEGDQRVRSAGRPCPAHWPRDTDPGRRRSARAATATSQMTSMKTTPSARRCRRTACAFMPPRNSMPIAIATITPNAPRSGCSISSMPTSADRDRHRHEALGELVHVVLLAHRVVGRVQHARTASSVRTAAGSATPSGIQRLAPLAPLPMPGTNTSTSSTKLQRGTRRAPAAASACIGIWKAITARAERDAERRSDGGRRKCVGATLKRGESGSAIDAEYTITMPISISASTTPTAAARRRRQRRRRTRWHAARRRVRRARASIRAGSHASLAAAIRRAQRGRPARQHGCPASAASSRTASTKTSARCAIVAEHVEAGAGRRQQHGIAASRRPRRRLHRFRQRVAQSISSTPARASAARIARASRPISTTARAWRATGAAQRREVLALAVAAGDQDQLAALVAQAVQRGDGGADVGALAVVVVLDAVDASRPARQRCGSASIVAQRVQHRRERQRRSRAPAQARPAHSARCAAADPQRIGRHQPVQVDLGGGRTAARRRLPTSSGSAQRLRPSQPCHAAVVAPGRSVRPASARRRRSVTHGRLCGAAIAATMRIVAVQHAHGAWREDARLARGRRHRAVPVEVILAHVEHGRGVARERSSVVCQLEAGQLEHPDLRAAQSASSRVAQRVERRRTDVAGHRDAHARSLDQQAGQVRDGGLAVGAGDADDLRRVARSAFSRASSRAKRSISPTHRDLCACAPPAAAPRPRPWRRQAGLTARRRSTSRSRRRRRILAPRRTRASGHSRASNRPAVRGARIATRIVDPRRAASAPSRARCARPSTARATSPSSASIAAHPHASS